MKYVGNDSICKQNSTLNDLFRQENINKENGQPKCILFISFFFYVQTDVVFSHCKEKNILRMDEWKKWMQTKTKKKRYLLFNRQHSNLYFIVLYCEIHFRMKEKKIEQKIYGKNSIQLHKMKMKWPYQLLLHIL